MKLTELADELRNSYFKKLKEGGDTDEFRAWAALDLNSIDLWKAVSLKAAQLLKGNVELEPEYLSYWEIYTATNRVPIDCSDCLRTKEKDETLDEFVNYCKTDCIQGCELHKLPCGCLLGMRRAFKYSNGNENTLDDDEIPVANTVISVGLLKEVNCREDHFKDQFYSPDKLGIFR